MAIPEEIRKVPRPVNTVVVTNGTNTAKRYAVRERTGVKYIPGGNPQPIYGKIIGHIINNKYVPLSAESSQQGAYEYPVTLSWGGAALLKTVSDDIVSDLLEVFDPGRVYTIISMATLRVLKPRISSNRFTTHYRNTFVSVYYPGAALSKNSISTLLSELGQRSDLVEKFYQKRIARIEKTHRIAIDGTLRQDTSKENDLSNFSYKARMKGCMEISVLYAFDIELGEPVCASVFPGNMPDCKAYGEFISTHNLKRGIIVGDKGFPSNVIAQFLENNKDLHYFNPLKRTSVYIKQYELLKFEECFSVGDNNVLCKRVYVIEEKKYLFSFVNCGMSMKEYSSFVASASKHKNFDFEKFAEKKETFGLILFESDLDMTLAEAYNVYKSRWKLEVVFGYYKADITQNQTNVQSDFSVMGMEFINFLSSLLTCRIVEKAQKAGLLKQVTYGVLMDDLNMVRRDVKNTPDNTLSKLKKGDPYWFHASNIAMEEMIQLGLVEADETTEGKVRKGRPPKNTEKENVSSTSSATSFTSTSTSTSPSVSSSSCNTDTVSQETGELAINATEVNRSRGRPPKPKDNSSEVVKRSRGRPRKEKTEDKPKRPRGRPRKERTEEEKVKRPRGRPRKTPS